MQFLNDNAPAILALISAILTPWNAIHAVSAREMPGYDPSSPLYDARLDISSPSFNQYYMISLR